MSVKTLDQEAQRVRAIFARSFKPKPVQEIADEIQLSYDDTLKCLVRIGESLPIRFTNITDVPHGLQAVKVVMGSQQKKKGRR